MTSEGPAGLPHDICHGLPSAEANPARPSVRAKRRHIRLSAHQRCALLSHLRVNNCPLPFRQRQRPSTAQRCPSPPSLHLSPAPTRAQGPLRIGGSSRKVGGGGKEGGMEGATWRKPPAPPPWMEASPMGALGDPVRLKKDVKVVLLPKKVLRQHSARGQDGNTGGRQHSARGQDAGERLLPPYLSCSRPHNPPSLPP